MVAADDPWALLLQGLLHAPVTPWHPPNNISSQVKAQTPCGTHPSLLILAVTARRLGWTVQQQTTSEIARPKLGRHVRRRTDDAATQSTAHNMG